MSLEDETVEVATKPRRAPRKRVTTESSDVASDLTVVKKRAPRKKATVTDETVVSESLSVKSKSRRVAAPAPEPLRKAPTPIAENKAATKTQRRQIIVVATLMIIGIGASAAIGYTDKGSINVEQTISNRNDQITKGEIQGEILSVQNTPQLPDGGLIGLGIGGPETGASSTPSTASSTPAASSTEPVGQVPLTEAEAQAAAAQASSTPQ